MSNSLAIATVTATLRQVLQAAVDEIISGANVKPVRPDAFKNGSSPRGVSVYLYQVTPNPSWRNADLPTRRADGSVVQRPQAALDLHYLLTFFGDENNLEPQQMLGSVVSALHAHPVLARDRIFNVILHNSFLKDSDLADQVELVKFTPHPLNLEELSRLWSVFFQIPYALSILYQASVVLIEAKETPSPARPVSERRVFSVPLSLPSIEQVIPPIVEFSSGARITLKGRNLAGPLVAVRFGDLEITPDAPVRDTELVVALPNGLHAGVRTARVVQAMDLKTVLEPHKGFESNAVAFILQPVVNSVSYDATNFSVGVSPEIGPRQQVSLLLNEASAPVGRPARAFSFDSARRATTTQILSFPAAAFPTGNYLVRVRVDNAESNMTFTVNVP